MAIGDGDLDLVLNDFGVAVTFDISPTDLVIDGVFTDATDEVSVGGQVMVEAQEPSVTVRTDQLTTAVKARTPVTVAGQNGSFLAERFQKLGTGYTVIYLSVV